MRGEHQDGFTMIELLVAMAVFSFILLLIVAGFTNIVRLHNQAIASNIAQDSARGAMAELVRGVRDSAGVVSRTAGPFGTLCLDNASGPQQIYYVDPVSKILYRADNCATRINAQAITSTSVQVSNFVATVKSTGPTIVKPEVQLTLTVASANSTTTGSGASIACGPTTQERTFCSTITLTSGAVPR